MGSIGTISIGMFALQGEACTQGVKRRGKSGLVWLERVQFCSVAVLPDCARPKASERRASSEGIWLVASDGGRSNLRAESTLHRLLGSVRKSWGSVELNWGESAGERFPFHSVDPARSNTVKPHCPFSQHLEAIVEKSPFTTFLFALLLFSIRHIFGLPCPAESISSDSNYISTIGLYTARLHPILVRVYVLIPLATENSHYTHPSMRLTS